MPWIQSRAGALTLLLLMLTGCAADPSQTDSSLLLGQQESRCPQADDAIDPQSPFRRALVKGIVARSFYPPDAALRKSGGLTMLCVRVLADGSLDRVLVRSSAGDPALDGAAVYAAGLYGADTGDAFNSNQTGSHLSPHGDHAGHGREHPPTALMAGREAIWIDVPVRFSNGGEPSAVLDQASANGCINDSSASLTIDQIAADGRTRTQFIDGFTSRLDANLPSLARPRWIKGTVNLRFQIASGQFICGRVDQSSGDALVDGLALMALGTTVADPAQVRDFGTLNPAPITFVLPLRVIDASTPTRLSPYPVGVPHH